MAAVLEHADVSRLPSRETASVGSSSAFRRAGLDMLSPGGRAQSVDGGTPAGRSTPTEAYKRHLAPPSGAASPPPSRCSTKSSSKCSPFASAGAAAAQAAPLPGLLMASTIVDEVAKCQSLGIGRRSARLTGAARLGAQSPCRSPKALPSPSGGSSARASLPAEVGGSPKRVAQAEAEVGRAALEAPMASPLGERVVRRGGKGLPRALSLDTKLAALLRGAADSDGEGSRVVSQRSHPAEELFTPGVVSSVWGKSGDSDVYQPYFSGKMMNVDNHARFGDLPHAIGVHCQRGKKPNSPNQDDFFVLQRKEWLCFGVMDGHGEHGHLVSHLAQESLPKCVLERCARKPCAPEPEWPVAVSAAFHEVAGKIKKAYPKETRASGTTASVAFLDCPSGSGKGPLRLRAAFVGDSSIVYGRRPVEGGPWQVRQLGENHRPDREDELRRINAVGGEVLPGCAGKSPPRLLCSAGGLAMSRSLGDFDAAERGLTCEPEVPEEVLLEEGFEHMLLICSDGIWDFVAPLAAVQLAARLPHQNAQAAAEKLAVKAQTRWQEAEPGMIDDITVCLVRIVLGQGKP